MSDKRRKRLFAWWLCAILALGFLLRIYKLSAKSIWFDEAYSLTYVQQNWADFLFSYFNYKPFSFAVLKVWTQIFGISAFAGRFLSVIYGMVSIYLVYEVGKRLFGREVGLYGAFFLSISCFHVYHSQQIRQMSFNALIWLVSYLLCVKIFFENKQDKKAIFLNSIINIFSIFTHPYGLALTISQNVFFIIKREKSLRFRRNWYWGQAVVILFLLLWLFIPNQKSYAKEMLWWIPPWNSGLIVETLETFSFGGPRYGLDDFNIIRLPLYIIGYILMGIYIRLFLTAMIPSNVKEPGFHEEKPKEIFLLTWLFCPILLATLVSFYKPVYVIKHLLYAVPAFYILCALGLSKIRENEVKIATILIIIVATIFPLQIMYTNDFNIDWRAPAGYIRNNMNEEDTIIISNLSEIVPFMYYFNYGKQRHLKNIGLYGKNDSGVWQSLFHSDNHCIMGIEGDRSRASKELFEDFDYKVSRNQFGWLSHNVWLASSRWSKADVFSYISIFFANNNYKLKSRALFNGVEVLYFQNNSSGAK